MKKRSKIKRYGNIYGRGTGSGSPLIVIGMLAGILLFALIGWMLYPPVHDLIMGMGISNGADPSIPAAPTETPSIPPSAVSSSESPAEPIPPPIRKEEGIAGIYAPMSATQDMAVLDSLMASAKDAGLSAVMVDAKDATGMVLYNTENPVSADARAIAETPFDARAVAKRVSDAGLIPIARIHAFRDNVLSHFSRGMAVSYYDTENYWLDNSPELGGKAWLNPYSSEAQQYIIDLAVELSGMGFEQIVVDSVQFPSGVALNKAGYGAQATVSRGEVLSDFVSTLQEAVAAAGGKALLYLPATAILSEDAMTYGGNPITTSAGAMVLGILPSALPDGIRVGTQTIASPKEDYAATVTDILAYARQAAPAGTEFTALLQAYGDDGTVLPVNELKRQIEAVEAVGIGYILFNPQGNYRLNG